MHRTEKQLKESACSSTVERGEQREAVCDCSFTESSRGESRAFCPQDHADSFPSHMAVLTRTGVLFAAIAGSLGYSFIQ
eukprot:1293222-Rhodomonas_salina.1